MSTPTEIDQSSIVTRIVCIRGQRVLFDSDPAEVYGVTTKRLNQQVNRNIERFPADSMRTPADNSTRFTKPSSG